MATPDEGVPIVLRTGTLDTALLELLLRSYSVVVERCGGELVIELYKQ